MYKPEYDVPLAVALSLAISLIAAYITYDNVLTQDCPGSGAMSWPSDVVH